MKEREIELLLAVEERCGVLGCFAFTQFARRIRPPTPEETEWAQETIRTMEV